MANITLNYKGLTGKVGTITAADTATLDSIINLILADEDPTVGVLINGDYNITLQRDTSITDSTNGSDPIAVGVDNLGLVNGDTIICIDEPGGTKEVRQERKGRISSVKREREGKTAYTWNKNRLPNPYEGNEHNVDDDENTGSLQAQRPWTTTNP